MSRKIRYGMVALGHLNQQQLANNLVLKGGNSIRKIYFPDTRFSDDLDFTAHHLPDQQIFRNALNAACTEVAKTSGIAFDLDKTTAVSKETPDPDCKALDGHISSKGSGRHQSYDACQI